MEKKGLAVVYGFPILHHSKQLFRGTCVLGEVLCPWPIASFIKNFKDGKICTTQKILTVSTVVLHLWAFLCNLPPDLSSSCKIETL